MPQLGSLLVGETRMSLLELEVGLELQLVLQLEPQWGTQLVEVTQMSRLELVVE